MSTGTPQTPSSGPQRVPAASSSAEPAELFSTGTLQRGKPERNWMSIAVAASIVVVGLGSFAYFGRNRTPPVTIQQSTLQPSTYAASLELSDVRLSQAENFAGSQVTYVDGTVTNHGTQTVTGITASATFPNDVGEAPQVETLPLLFIRTHEPYIDTEPITSAPLAPGQSQEFRLIFDDINGLWNQNPPQLAILGVNLTVPKK